MLGSFVMLRMLWTFPERTTMRNFSCNFAAVVPPGPPENVTLIPLNGAFELIWQAPVTGDPATYYRIVVKDVLRSEERVVLSLVASLICLTAL